VVLGKPEELAQHVAAGATTADFHAALGSDPRADAFRPEPVQPGDIDAWSAELLDRVSRACALIEARFRDWPEEPRRLGASILEESHRAQAVASAGREAAAGFHKMRIHGDYHLGQTLKTPAGFAIIDFEGEPARPIADRRQKHCALKDVAGMLRSFEYAIETAAGHTPGLADRLRASPGLRAPFLEGYFESSASHAVASIPSDGASLAHWLAFFELEKALYELEYEVNNRPTWAHIPLRGILRALGLSA
jgi:maltose alpha-D-glucosyltransferase/alpha-amylase